MQITEVRIKLTEDSDDRLQAFCSITFDHCFVVRDLKIIEGTNGPFVAMPSRKLTSHCPRCRCKNHLRASYCNQCGSKLNAERAPRDAEGRAKLYADIAHPINSACREAIQEKVIAAYQEELELAKEPGYVSRYDDDYGDEPVAGEARNERATSAAAADTPPPTPATISVTAGSFQRMDTPRRFVEPPAPHLTPAPSANTVPSGTGNSNTGNSSAGDSSAGHSSAGHSEAAATPPRRKSGFGAGILDD